MLAVSLVVGFMSLLDVTIVNVAVPSIRAGLDTSAATIQWVVSGYALAFGMTLVAGGRLGDAHGRRRMMTIGLIGFVVSSLAVGLAPNAAAIVVARLVQGASAGLLTPQNSGLIQQLFRGEERGRAFGMFGFTVAVASAAGPLIGGLLIGLLGEENGWRSLFLINVPIGLVALVLIRRMVPDNDAGAGAEKDPRVDLPGALLLGLAVLAVLYPLISLEGGAGLPLVLLLAFPPLAWAFVRWEVRTVGRGHPPLLDVSLLRGLPGYANGLLVGTLYFTGFTGIFLVLSVHLQEGEGFSPLQAALLMTPFAFGAATTSPLAGRLVGRLGRKVTLVALSVMMTGTALAALLVTQPTDRLWWTLAPAMFLAGVGGGGVISPNFTLSLAEVPPQMGGAAGGALQTGQRIGSALGAALLMTVYQAVDAMHLRPGRGALGPARGARRARGRVRRRRTVLAARGLEDRARDVRRRLGVAGRERLDPGDDRTGLGDGSAGELDRVGDERLDLVAGEAEAGVGGELGEDVVVGLAGAHREGGADGGLLDRLVGGLAADAVADRRHQHLGGGEEGQVAVELALDHGREGAELVEHGEEGLEEAVGGEEGVGQRDPAHDRAGHVALVPLVAGELADHRQVAAQDDREAVDPLAGAGVHLVGHGRRADLALLEALGDQLVPGHQPDRRREVGRAAHQLHERGDDVEVERARVDLADAGQRLLEAEVGGDPLLEVAPACRRRRRAGRACPARCPSAP